MIAWSPSLSVGVHEIDAQHQELFRRAELFLSGVETCTRQEIGVLLSYLRFYVVTHFGSEEAWMRETEYPGYAAHKRQHDRLVKDLLALSRDVERRGGPGLDGAKVGAWLVAWLTEHIGRTDVELARWLVAIDPRLDVHAAV